MARPDDAQLALALSSLRMALPALQLVMLALRYVLVAFVRLMRHIQERGWRDHIRAARLSAPVASKAERETLVRGADDEVYDQDADDDDEDEDEPEILADDRNRQPQALGKQQQQQQRVGESSSEQPASEVLEVVVKVSTTRRALVLALFAFTALSYFLEGIFHVIASVVTQTWTPARSALYAYTLPLYALGMLALFALVPVVMTIEEKSNGGASSSWGWKQPMLVSSVSLVGELCLLGSYGTLLKSYRQQGASIPIPLLAYGSVGLMSVRTLLLLLLVASQTRLLQTSRFVPAHEREALLGAGGGERTTATTARSYGTLDEPRNDDDSDGNDENGGAAANKGKKKSSSSKARRKGKNPLRSSRPPSNRPPDPKSLSLATLVARVRALAPYLWPSKSITLQLLALICIGLMLLARALNLLVPVQLGRVVQDLSTSQPPWRNLTIYIVAYFTNNVQGMLRGYLWLPIEQFSEREMSMLAFDTLLNLSLSYHLKRRTGELLRILDRADAINDMAETFLFQLVPIIVDLSVAFVFISVRYGAVISAIIVVVGVIYGVASVQLAQSRLKLYRGLRDEDQFMRQIKTDTLLNWETTKVFTAEQFESRRLRNALRAYQRKWFDVYSAWNSLSLIQSGISTFGLLLCTTILAQRVTTGEMQVGEFVTFVSYINSVFSPIQQLASLYRNLTKALVDTEQLMELLKEERDIVDLPGASELILPDAGELEQDQERGAIEFDDVHFSYDGKRDVLKGISFKVHAGQKVAIVGPSGAGKSTITRLVYRFYEPTAGGVKIDGKNIRDYTQLSLRRNIGLVPQDAVLHNETLRYNIAYGNLKGTATEQDVVEAAKSANLYDKILSWPGQFETRVGERGQRLSGGEKQRVAIARMLLKNPPILLLDEATSALDTTNERAIQARLRELSRGRTTISIAHRLSTIIDSDVILVLQDGVIVETGSHSDLLEKGPEGVYYQLWQKQIEGDQQDGAESGSRSRRGSASRASTPRPGTSTPSGTVNSKGSKLKR